MYYVLREKKVGIEGFSVNGKTPDDVINRSRYNLDFINPSYTLLSVAEIFLIQSVFSLDIEILNIKSDWPGYNTDGVIHQHIQTDLIEPKLFNHGLKTDKVMVAGYQKID